MLLLSLFSLASIVVSDSVDFEEETAIGALALLIIHMVPEAFLTYLDQKIIWLKGDEGAQSMNATHLLCTCNCTGRILSLPLGGPVCRFCKEWVLPGAGVPPFGCDGGDWPPHASYDATFCRCVPCEFAFCLRTTTAASLSMTTMTSSPVAELSTVECYSAVVTFV